MGFFFEQIKNEKSNAKHHMSLPKWVMSEVGWGKL